MRIFLIALTAIFLTGPMAHGAEMGPLVKCRSNDGVIVKVYSDGRQLVARVARYTPTTMGVPVTAGQNLKAAVVTEVTGGYGRMYVGWGFHLDITLESFVPTTHFPANLKVTTDTNPQIDLVRHVWCDIAW
jgi:hypothetical protein